MNAPIPQSNRKTCRELVELTTEYLDGALSQPERRGFEAHLESCVDCAAYLDQLNRTIELTSEPASSPADSVVARLKEEFREWKEGR